MVNGSALSGTYTSQVSGGGGSISGPITGYVTGDIVAFSVLWPTPAGSITSWIGQIVDEGGKPTLKTLWHLVINIPDANEPTGLWETMLAGSDTFAK